MGFDVGDENSLCSSLDDPFMITGDSTRSLLAPLYDDSFQGTEFRELPNDCCDGAQEKDVSISSLLSQSISSICPVSVSRNKSSLSSYKNEDSSVKSLSHSSDLESKSSKSSEGKCIKEVGINMSWEQWLQKKMSEDIEDLNLKREKRMYK